MVDDNLIRYLGAQHRQVIASIYHNHGQAFGYTCTKRFVREGLAAIAEAHCQADAYMCAVRAGDDLINDRLFSNFPLSMPPDLVDCLGLQVLEKPHHGPMPEGFSADGGPLPSPFHDLVEASDLLAEAEATLAELDAGLPWWQRWTLNWSGPEWVTIGFLLGATLEAMRAAYL